MLRFAEKLKHSEVNNLAEVLDTWYQDQIGVNDMVDNESGRNLLTLKVCKKERHRSVTAKHLITRTVRDILPDIEVNEPLTTYFGRHLCVRVGHCKFCAHEQMKDKITRAYTTFGNRMIKSLNDCQDPQEIVYGVETAEERAEKLRNRKERGTVEQPKPKPRPKPEPKAQPKGKAKQPNSDDKKHEEECFLESDPEAWRKHEEERKQKDAS